MDQRPLVSIIIVTYNSSPWVTETLDSVKAQTYSKYELIISDDCSVDDTVEVCRRWIDSYNNTNLRVKLIEANHNTGVAGNCNRGLAAAQGQWLKFIAGDDMLAPTAIEDYVNFVSSHPETRHLIAKSVHFTGNLKESDLLHPTEVYDFFYREEATVEFQYKIISRIFFGSGPTYFINSDALRSLGGFDERFQMQEDYPLFIKMIGKGHKMMFMNRVTVYKRMVSTSLQYDKEVDDIFSKNQVRMVLQYRYLYREEVLSPIWRVFHNYSLWIQTRIIKSGNSFKSLKCRMYNILYRLTDPFLWYSRYIRIQKKLYKCSTI